jgi:hypothetical protein
MVPPSPRSAVASMQGDVLRGGGRAHPSSNDSATAGAEAEAEHTPRVHADMRQSYRLL